MKVSITYGPPARRKPQLGDQKTIRGVLHERRICRDREGNYLRGHGRYLIEWVPVEEKSS